MTVSDQIAAINAKAEAEHRAVDLKRDKLIQQVRDRCVHEPVRWFNALTGEFIMSGDECKHCGAPMQGG